MTKWFLRNFICRFRGHVDGKLMPLYAPWYGGMPSERGSIHCKRCGAMIGSY